MSNRSSMIKNDLANNHRYTDTMLYCIVLGDAIRKTFLVTINDKMEVPELREIIRKKKEHYFNGLKADADQLILWKVEIHADNMDLDATICANDVKKELRGEELDPFKEAYVYFNKPEHLSEKKPSRRIINIIVQPPTTTEGLGGTTYRGLEKGFFYEGVNLTSETLCQREPTINKLFESLLKERIILIRSPPMTGKTSLGQLLEVKLLQLDEVQNGSARVFRISLMWMEDLIDPSWTFADGFKMLMNMTWNEFLNQCGYKKTYLIIDEVQKIYRQANGEPHHGGSVFWNSFKRIMQNLQLFIVALASYGHYGAYATRGNRLAMDMSPINNLTAKNKWGYKDVCYTEEEFKDYFDRFCEVHLKKKLVKDDIPCLFSYLSEITAYHPGLIAYTMDHIGENFTKWSSNSLSFDTIFSYLKSQDFNDLFKTIRAFYPVTDLSDEERAIVDSVLFKKEA